MSNPNNQRSNDSNNGRPNNSIKLILFFIIIFLLIPFLFLGREVGQIFGIPEYPASSGTTAGTNAIFPPGSIVLAAASLLPIAFIVLMAFIVLKVLRRPHQYSRQRTEEYDDRITRKAVFEIIPDAQFRRNDCIPPGILRGYGILPAYDDYVSEGMIHYRKNEKDYSCSNIHLTKERTDPDGNTTDDTCYLGQAYTAGYKTNLPGSIRILSTGMGKPVRNKSRSGYPSKRPEETEIKTDNIEFNDNFDVYATDGQSASSVLTPLVMEQLLEMKKRYKQLGVYINGNQLVITLKTNRTLFAPKWYKPEKEADALESVKRDVRDMLKTAELLENSVNGSADNNFTSTWH